jgi:collagenase-like PrtC family protease
MKFAVGYQLFEGDGEEPFIDVIRDYRNDIAEVYFPWGDMPSGRSPLASRRGYTNWGAQNQLIADLCELRSMGIKLDLLFNANCYGGQAISKHLESQIASVIDYLTETVGGIDIITTTSLAIARTVKKYYPDIKVRASVNMRIGTVKGMEYIADTFDEYYVQREFNRNLTIVKELKNWADANGKGLYMLASSGCLNFCSGQTFHDNMVAHEKEIAETENIEDWIPHICWNYLKNRDNWPAVLQNSWVRPEDLHHYDDIFSVVKLATRMHSRPRLVLQSYTTRRHYGNLLDLLEPGYSPAFAPNIINNSDFPSDWFAKTSTCGNQCHNCDYCARVLEGVLR